jgi:hypothetical protein
LVDEHGVTPSRSWHIEAAVPHLNDLKKEKELKKRREFVGLLVGGFGQEQRLILHI